MSFRWRTFSGLRRYLLLLFFLVIATKGGWAQTGLTLRGESGAGEQGASVTVVFRTQGFWEITEGMGTIAWDPHVMDYASAGDFGIPELGTGTFTRIPEGMLIFSWSTTNLLGNTLSDGTILFSLTFDLRGEPGQSTAVAFTSGWTPLHFESVTNINLPFTSVPGHVSIVPEPTTVFLAFAGAGLLVLRRSRRKKIARARNVS